MTDDDDYKMQCEKEVLTSMLKSEFNKGYEQGKKDLLKQLIAESFEYNEHKISQERLKELMKNG